MLLFEEKENPHFDLLQLLYFNSTCEFQNDNRRDLSQLLSGCLMLGRRFLI